MIFIKNANIHTMAGKKYKKGCILINNDTINEVGENIKIPKDTKVDIIDAKGAFVLPGMIDAHCHIGLKEQGEGKEGMDLNETSNPITPYIRAIDGINPFDEAFKAAIKTGITTVMTGPGSSNPIGGQFTIMKTYGKCVDNMIVKKCAAIKASLGENPKRIYGNKSNMPITRMGTAALIRQTLFETKNYIMKKENSIKEKKTFEENFKLEPLIPLLKREIPMKFHVHRADDIITAIRIAKEFNILITLDHCTEGNKVLEYIKQYDIPIILGPNISFSGKVETRNKNHETPKILKDNNMDFAIITDHPVISIEYLPLCAGIAVKYGLDKEEALKSITINAAKILGLADILGSIERGKKADILIYSGNPIDISSKNLCTILNGEIVYKCI
ncbi:amidohydrolase [Clostridium oceanicum]|uniref:Amidohydrolase n=1 Tax=Clostridium oceanicum TaxID=1543 RepID=A0ABP3UNB6_9CLOT